MPSPMPSMSTETYPIDFRSAYEQALADAVANEPVQDTSSVYAELGGLRNVRTLTDNPTVYVPFAEIAISDEKKLDIVRGLGGLGLLAITAADFDSMSMYTKENYATALRDYHKALGSRSSVLATDGSIYSPYFQKHYQGADQNWASEYAVQLAALRNTLADTSLFAAASNTPQSRRRSVQTKDWALHTTARGKFTVHKPTARGKASTQRAA